MRCGTGNGAQGAQRWRGSAPIQSAETAAPAGASGKVKAFGAGWRRGRGAGRGRAVGGLVGRAGLRGGVSRRLWALSEFRLNPVMQPRDMANKLEDWSSVPALPLSAASCSPVLFHVLVLHWSYLLTDHLLFCCFWFKLSSFSWQMKFDTGEGYFAYNLWLVYCIFTYIKHS